MSISVRLDKETEAILEKTAGILHATKSTLVKRSLRAFCANILEEKKKHPFELIKDLLDKEGSGRGDLSVRGEEILRTAFKRKR